MNELLIKLLRVRVQGAIAASAAIDGIDHNALKGRIREIFVHDLLSPFLPSYAGIGTGKSIDSTGKQSNEVDVVIYDRDLMPALMLGQRESLFPIEAVLYVIEVKSSLSLKELRDTTKKAKYIRRVSHLFHRVTLLDKATKRL